MKHIGWTETEGIGGCLGDCERCSEKMSRSCAESPRLSLGPRIPKELEEGRDMATSALSRGPQTF